MSIRRTVAYGLSVTLALTVVFFLVDRTVDQIVNEVEVVLQPCSHGGTWNGKTCDCVGPWGNEDDDPYCNLCTCVHGQCDQNNVNVPFSGTLWGCRCEDKWMGQHCDVCFTENEETCDGDCLPGYGGSKCQLRCQADVTFDEILLDAKGEYEADLELILSGGIVSACSGHGACREDTKSCVCEPSYFPSVDERSECARTCARSEENELCYGHGVCGMNEGIVACECERGWHLESDCSLGCPGMELPYIQEPCSGKGVCSIKRNGNVSSTVCDCNDLYVGEACQYKCPTGKQKSSVPCNGHGTCSFVFPLAQCDCQPGWTGEGCQCNDFTTCHGHGVCMSDPSDSETFGNCNCDEHWQGEGCNECVPGRWGSECQLLCKANRAYDPSVGGDEYGCNKNGVCLVVDFARATERVACGCSGNFDTETACLDCEESWYPKYDAAKSVSEAAVTTACSVRATRNTCNRAGDPSALHGLQGEKPCDCDGPNVDGWSHCTKCKTTWFPDGDMTDPNACMNRCVDAVNGGDPTLGGLVCKNGGVCDPMGDRCLCPEGFTGLTCDIECGDACSGHGKCVTDILQRFLAPEILNSADGGTAYRCECNPITSVSDEERLKVFSGDEIDFGGETVENTYDYYGATCQHSCLKAPWLDGLECNGQQCRPVSVKRNDGSAALTCKRDDECGEWNPDKELLEFFHPNGGLKVSCDGTEADDTLCLTAGEKKMRGMVSLQTRWTDTMGPFCHVPAMPLGVNSPNMGCVERVNENSVEQQVEDICEKHDDDKTRCLNDEVGLCKYIDKCEEAMDKYDAVSYCHELMRTARPPALRSASCAEHCDSKKLEQVDWSKKCTDFENRVPERFRECSDNLDALCEDDAFKSLEACTAALPSGSSLNAANGAALCFELSQKPESLSQTFSFVPILDTPEARSKQALFHPKFHLFQERHECVKEAFFDLPALCPVYDSFSFQGATPVYLCRGDDVFVSQTDVTTVDVTCEVLSSEKEFNPFRLRCPDADVAVEKLSLMEALQESFDSGCSLRGGDLSGSVQFDAGQADEVCARVLEDEMPNDCLRVCGEDHCVSVGTTQSSKIFECRRPDFSDVSPSSCLMGTFVRTGRHGGAEYRCAVPLESLKTVCRVNYAYCENTLAMHVADLSEVSESAAAPAAPPTAAFEISKTDVKSFVKTSAFFSSPVAGVSRAEFDVRITAAGRGRVSVDGEKGSIASILLHYYSDDVWHLNDDSVEGATSSVEVSDFARVVLEWDADEITAYYRNGEEVQIQTRARTSVGRDVGGFVGFSVSGTAEIREAYAFRPPIADESDCGLDMCASLARKLPEAFGQDFDLLKYCVSHEKAFGVSECSDEASRDAVFRVPWREACAYQTHAESLGTCEASLAREEVVQCEPALSHFSTVACALDAAENYDWEVDYCQPLEEELLPSLLQEAGCFADDECFSAMLRSDFGSFCSDRKVYWDENNEEIPKIPEGCVDDAAAADRWRSEDWQAFCMSKAQNLQQGVCAVATCDCHSQGNSWLSGNACELQCPVGSTNSCCNEATFSGVCDYLERDKEAADAYYRDETLILKTRASEIQGRCRCSNPRAISEEGCDATCQTDDEKPLCNNRKYVSGGEEYQISACSTAGTGSCACLPLETRQVRKKITFWDGRESEVTAFEYGGDPNDSVTNFRLRATQGPQSLMENFFGYDSSTWQAARDKFELDPGSFTCHDGNKCDFHDVVLAQTLYLTSGFWGPECAQRCPGVDTGERMLDKANGCSKTESDFLKSDRLTEEACKTACLDSWRCNFARYEPSTSFCMLFSDCVGSETQAANWKERKLSATSNFVPCGGRGRCTPTSGQCVCDTARYLSISDPITQRRQKIQSNKRSFLPSNIPVTTLDLTGWRGLECELQCPGYSADDQDMTSVCSNHGVCSREASCQCESGYTGINCELKCPQRFGFESETTVCSGHGTCFEARLQATSNTNEKEDVQRYFSIQEAWHNWYNLCDQNPAVEHFILPYGNYPGTIPAAEIKGGVLCELVPQIDTDDPKLPFIERPEIEFTTLTDFELDDKESDMRGVGAKGVSDEFDRTGQFRMRHWGDYSETLFVTNYLKTQFEDQRVYDRFEGYKCGGVQIGVREIGLETAGACAQLCERIDSCACFDYQEYYHSSFYGGCRLAEQGPLDDYPIKSAVRVGLDMGLLTPSDVGDPVAFDEFGDVYVSLQEFKSCRAPVTNLGSNVQTLSECAQLCAQDEGCVYFSYNRRVLRCLEVQTSSSSCPEGFSTDPSGFYVTVVADQGAAAPVAFVVGGSARIFPKDKVRGKVDTKQMGRGRPNFKIALAQCLCADNYALGHWSGGSCNTCSRWWGTKTCSKPCPGILIGSEPCFGFGKCLYGSKNGDGQEFYNSICLCGNPSAPAETDLTLTGTWDVVEHDLYVETQFKRLTGMEVYWENPNNYNFEQDGTCRSCKPEKGGLNCASAGTFCLYNGYSVYSATSQSVSVPCQCTSSAYDSLNGCCPFGWMMSNTINELHKFAETVQNRRLGMLPGNIFMESGKFYDDTIPVMTAQYPSRRYCQPCPNVYEENWMPVLRSLDGEPTSACQGDRGEPTTCGKPCAGKGFCSDRPRRKLVSTALPPRYQPTSCSELTDEWKQTQRDLWFVHEEKVLQNVANQESDLVYSKPQEALFDHTHFGEDFTKTSFIESCQASCAQMDRCQGIVLKRKFGTLDIWCYLSMYDYISEPSPLLLSQTQDFKFTTHFRKVEYDLCRKPQEGGAYKYCSLGSMTYGEIELCSDADLSTYDEPSFSMNNLGKFCIIDDGEFNCVRKSEGSNKGLVCTENSDRYQGPATGQACEDVVAKHAQLNSDLNWISDAYKDLPAYQEWERARDSIEWETDYEAAVLAAQNYVPDADTLAFGAYGNNEFVASVHKKSNSIGESRPDNPCASLPGGQFYWNKDNRFECVEANTGRSCSIHDWVTCEKNVLFSSSDTLHSEHKNAKLPHSLLVNGEDKEVLAAMVRVPDCVDSQTVKEGCHLFAFNKREVDLSNIEKQIEELEGTPFGSIVKAKFDRDLAKGALATAQTSLDNEIIKLREQEAIQKEASRVVCGSVPTISCSTPTETVCFFSCWTVTLPQVCTTNSKQVCSQWDAALAVSAAESYNNIQSQIDTVYEPARDRAEARYNNLITEVENLQTQLSNLKASKDSFENENSCDKNSQCDMCQRNCQSTDECRSDLQCVGIKDKFYSVKILNVVVSELLKTAWYAKENFCDYGDLDDREVGSPDSKYCLPHAWAADGDLSSTERIFRYISTVRSEWDHQVYLLGYVSEANVYSTVFVRVKDNKVTHQFSHARHLLRDSDSIPTNTNELLAMRKLEILSEKPDVIKGFIFAEGMAGTVPRPGQTSDGSGFVPFQLNAVTQRRGFPAETAEDCAKLCESTPGCTAAEHVPIHPFTEAGCTDRVCGICEGSCTNNDDCLGNLVCQAEDGTNLPLGCSGAFISGNKYCISPHALKRVKSSRHWDYGHVFKCMLHTAYPDRNAECNSESADFIENLNKPDFVSQDQPCHDTNLREIVLYSECKRAAEELYGIVDGIDSETGVHNVPEVATGDHCHYDGERVLFASGNGELGSGHKAICDQTPNPWENEEYVTITENTCAFLGHLPVESAEECIAAQESLSMLESWTPDLVSQYREYQGGIPQHCIKTHTHSMYNSLISTKLCNPTDECICKKKTFKTIPSHAGTAVLRKQDRCQLCKSKGMVNSGITSINPAEALLECESSQGERACHVFPMMPPGGSSIWAPQKRCPPVRSGFENMHTSIVRVGESFTLSDSRPFVILKKHPDIDSPAQCEIFCVDELRCRAWHYHETVLEGQKTCELYDYEPEIKSTASELDYVFSGVIRIGTVQRSFASSTLIIDDGNSAACDCEDPDSGYTCRCVASSNTPFLPNEPGDQEFGCSGHGKCNGLDYSCVCDPGYEWQFDIASMTGFTCRQCGVGQFSSDTTRGCTACPAGKYSDNDAATSCKSCSSGKTTFQTSRGGMVEDDTADTGVVKTQKRTGVIVTGGTSSSDCTICPPGRIAGTTGCVVCAVGEYADDYGETKCKNCPDGYTTSDYGMASCDVFLYAERCEILGWGWQEEEDIDREILGGAQCAECVAGRYNDDASNTRCDKCPSGFASTVDRHSCETCPVGKFSDTTCKDCPAGFVSPDAAVECTACLAGKFADVTCQDCPFGKVSQDAAAACTECPTGRFYKPGNQDVCFVCPAGYYTDQTMQHICKGCVAGKYNDKEESIAESACTDCEAGKYNINAGQSVCDDCEEGRFSNEIGLDVMCKYCPPGKSGDEAGMTTSASCKQCEAGKHSELNTAGCYICPYNQEPTPAQDACQDCSEGKYTDSTSDGQCQMCPTGFYTNSDCGTDNCCYCSYRNTQYPKSNYQDEEGQGSCKHCPMGKNHFTTGQFSTNVQIALLEEIPNRKCLSFNPPDPISNDAAFPNKYTCWDYCTSNYPGTVAIHTLPGDFGISTCSCCDTTDVEEYMGSSTWLLKEMIDPGFYGCLDCPVGMYSDEDPKELNPLYNVASEGCKACTTGYQDQEGQTGCKNCPSGFVFSIDENVCNSCPIGYDRDSVEDAGLPCQKCAIGKYSDQLSEVACKICPAGYQMLKEEASTSCTICAAGQFSANVQVALLEEIPNRRCLSFNPPDPVDSVAAFPTLNNCWDYCTSNYRDTTLAIFTWPDSSGLDHISECSCCDTTGVSEYGGPSTWLPGESITLLQCQNCPEGKNSVAGSSVCD